MNEIVIKEVNNLEPLHKFLEETKPVVDSLKGLALKDESDISMAVENIKELQLQEKALSKAKDKVLELAGIDIFDKEFNKRRDIRLDLNSQVVNLKQKLKDEAINYFVSNAKELIDKSNASNNYKSKIQVLELAHSTIKGKSKNIMKLIKIQLEVLENGLIENEKETAEKLKVINSFDDDLVRDKEYLLSLSIEAIKPTLELRLKEREDSTKEKAEAIAKQKIEEEKRARELEEKKKEEVVKKEVEITKTDNSKEFKKETISETKKDEKSWDISFSGSVVCDKDTVIKLAKKVREFLDSDDMLKGLKGSIK